jgi:hypothetical protein
VTSEAERRQADVAADEDHPVDQALRVERGYQRPRRKFDGADRLGAMVAVIGRVIGLGVGGVAAVTAVIPASALWMSGVVCISGYHLAYNNWQYSYQPGRPGPSENFQCVNGDSSYDVGDLAIFGLQCSLAAFVLCIGLAVGGSIWRRLRKM